MVAPRHEWALFNNRDKFDLVAIYDDASETMGDARSPLSALVRAIFETSFKKFLKHIPVLLVGGLQAWKREAGEAELTRGPQDARDPAHANANVSALMGSASSPSTNGMSSTIGSDSRSPSLKSIPSAHARLPAEISSSSSSPPLAPGDSDGILFGRPRSGTQAAAAAADANPHKLWHPSHSPASMSLDHSSLALRCVTATLSCLLALSTDIFVFVGTAWTSMPDLHRRLQQMARDLSVSL